MVRKAYPICDASFNPIIMRFSMSHKRISYAVIIVASLLFSPLAAWSAADTRVEFSSGRISVLAEDVTLSSVAAQLSKTAGVSVYLDRSEEARKVSVNVQGASFEKALKSLVYPLNFAIVSDQNGTVTELRIFRNTGLKDSEYHLFAAASPAEVKPVSLPARTATAAKITGSTPSTLASRSSAPSPSTSRSAGALAGPSRLLTGEKAFQANIWATAQMMEAEQVRQNMQVKADQAEMQARELASITAITQMSGPDSQQANTPPQTGPGVLAAQQSQQSSASAYQQYASQQSGFNSSVYYQQWLMRQNYSFYNVRRGQ